MSHIRNFDELVDHLRIRGDRKRVAVVWATDHNTQTAVSRALEVGFIDAIFVGARQEVEKNAVLMRFARNISFVEASDSDDAAAKAVQLIRDGGADILMKGLLNTDNLLKAMLNRDHGMLRPGRTLTHITAMEMPAYPKLLFFTDPAVIPYPTEEQRVHQIEYIAYVTRALGIECPKIALIHCTEKINERHFPFSATYPRMIQMAQDGAFGKCIVDGPMDVRTACNYDSMVKKGLTSPINGEADALIFPDIVSANVFYKTVSLFASATAAAILQGAMTPVVLPSRSDSVMSKFYSLALAAL